MDILLRSVGPGVHCYSPFPKCPVVVGSVVQSLEELCKNSILNRITVRGLARAVHSLPLPKRLKGYISDLSTTDFEQIECAPFSDAFSFHFFHRALTYRVVCLRDGQEYMMAYGHSSPVELMTSQEEWVKIQHKNIMSVHATVRDPCTDNVFYLYDQPFVSLGQMWTIFDAKNFHVPMEFFLRLTTDLCEALHCISSNGLYYGHFGLDNIFVTDDRLVLENGLMQKSIKKHSCDERSAIINISNVLKLLLEFCDDKVPYIDDLKDFVKDIECQNSIVNILNEVLGSIGSIHSFSFTKHINDLQNLLMGGD